MQKQVREQKTTDSQSSHPIQLKPKINIIPSKLMPQNPESNQGAPIVKLKISKKPMQEMADYDEEEDEKQSEDDAMMSEEDGNNDPSFEED